MKYPAVMIAGALLAPAAFAADPVATALPGGYSFVEYSGVSPVGVGAVDIDNTLFFIDEKTVGGAKSWLIFFDAKKPQGVIATVKFDAPIIAVYTTRADVEATTPTYGATGITYAFERLTGLESRDSVAFTLGGNTVSIDWTVIDPGDHIRVLTAVPEPGSYAMLAGGLGVLGWLGRRRRRDA